eukprot:gene4235-4484_t
MAQTEQGQTGVCLAGVGKVRIKLKLPLSVRKPVLHGIHASASAPIDQLAELHAAVEAFCRQGVHGLPGCMLLSPWRETSPAEELLHEQQEEAISYLASIMSKAKNLKHQGDKRQASLGGWDVFGLAYYALSSVEFLLYWDTALRLLERLLMDTMQELLRMTDGMHQTVMRMQQFLESPDVLANEHARTAALHISVLGLDAGMFSLPRVAAHTEAAVMSIMKLLRGS